jgi:hypothetical protein
VEHYPDGGGSYHCLLWIWHDVFAGVGGIFCLGYIVAETMGRVATTEMKTGIKKSGGQVTFTRRFQ